MSKSKKSKDWGNLSMTEIIKYLDKATVSFDMLRSVTKSVVTRKTANDVNTLKIYIMRKYGQFMPIFNEIKSHSQSDNVTTNCALAPNTKSPDSFSGNHLYAERNLNIPKVFSDDTPKAYTSIMLYLSKNYGFYDNVVNIVESRSNSQNELLGLSSSPLSILRINGRVFAVYEPRLFGDQHSTIVIEIAKGKDSYAAAIDYIRQYFQATAIYKRDMLLKEYKRRATPPCITNVTLIRHLSPKYWSNQLLITLGLTIRNIKQR